MALSPNLSVIRVTGFYVDAAGAPATGNVTFTLSAVMVDRVANQIILPTPVVVTLVGGAFAVDLPASDDPDLVPTNLFYTVREVIASQQRTYTIVLPFGGGPIDLADVVPLSSTPSPNYLLFKMSALADVQVASVADGNVLVYQASTQTWVPGVGGGGGGGGTPASTVQSAQTFGIAPAVGSSVTFARGDHQHGTVALGTTSTTAAAGNHGHSGFAASVHTHVVTDVTNLTNLLNAKLDLGVLAAKGDLVVATGPGTAARLAVGTNGQALLADSTQTTGLRFGTVTAGGGTGRTLVMSKAGTLAIGTGTTRIYNDSGAAWTLVGVRATVGTPPTGGPIVIDVNLSGTTMFAGAKPTISATATTSGLATGMTVTSIPVGGFLTVDVDAVGTTVPGADLVVQVEIA